MKRMRAIGMIALAGALGSVGLAHAGVRRAVVAAPDPSRAHLSDLACRTAALQADRSVSVRASMRPVAGTEKLQIRFDLLSRTGAGAAFAEVPGGLGPWSSPANPTLGQRPGDVWIVSHSVSNLPAPASYRYRVSFRWEGSGGRVLATVTRVSADCHQPLFQPDLRVASISLAPIPGKPKKEQYTATIENVGPAATPGPFAVSFTPAASLTPGDAATATTKTLPALAAGASAVVSFVGPACTAATAPTVAAAGNALAVDPTCPAVTSAPAAAPLN